MDLSKWAVVSFKDDTGLGRQATDIRSVLNLGFRLVVSSSMEDKLEGHQLEPPFERTLDHQGSDDHVREAIDGLQGIISLERHYWHRNLFQIAKEQGIKIVCIPNWEWFNGKDAQWKLCDLFVCQSQFTVSIVEMYGYRNTVYIPAAVNLPILPTRTVNGPARLFVHNAGLVNIDDRKGTRDAIAAFNMVSRKDLKLIVRLQKEVDLPKTGPSVEIRVGNLPDPSALYTSGDCFIQPSKMEGNGFMVLEPFACGLPVITTDYPPMNEYIRQKEMLVKKRWFKRRAFPSQWVPHAHLRLPDIADIARKINWCAENDLAPISRENRRLAEELFAAENLQELWQQALSKL